MMKMPSISAVLNSHNLLSLKACLVVAPDLVKALQWFSALFHLLLIEAQDGDKVENVVLILWVRE